MTHPAAAGLVSLGNSECDLDLTVGCGQVFHWTRDGAGYVGLIADSPVYVEQRKGRLMVSTGAEEIARRYFALDHPLPAIYASFPEDPAMSAALEFCRGMRIVRQPLWECTATFITSSMKQVAHIAQISHTLRRRFGKRVEWNRQLLPVSPPQIAAVPMLPILPISLPPDLFTYPTPEALAALKEEDLRACALGYRARHLLGAARAVASGEVDLDAVARMDDDEARAELCRLPGVGVKVANCALLFAFERLRAFPIDVWIERVLRETYFPKTRKITAKKLGEFSAKYFGEYGGYAQQYLFHHARKTRARVRTQLT